jgi:hypothetical protein
LPTTLPVLREIPRDPAELHQEERGIETDYFRYKSLLSRLIQIDPDCLRSERETKKRNQDKYRKVPESYSAG